MRPTILVHSLIKEHHIYYTYYKQLNACAHKFYQQYQKEVCLLLSNVISCVYTHLLRSLCRKKDAIVQLPIKHYQYDSPYLALCT